MKRLMLVLWLLGLASNLMGAELQQQQAAVVPAPAVNGFWLAFGPDGKSFVPETLPDGSVLLKQSCTLVWSQTAMSSTAVIVSPGPVVPPTTGPTAELTLSPDTIKKGEKVVVSWKAGGTAKSATLQGVMVALAGTQEFAPPETTEFVLTAADGSQTVAAKKTVVVDGTGPQPPPKPDFPPSPAVTGLTLLGVRVPIWPANTPQAMIDVEMAKQVRDYLSANCPKDKSGAASFRFVAPGDDLNKEKDPLWKELMAMPTGDVKPPFWLIRSPTAQSIIPWPSNPTAAVESLRKMTQTKGEK